MAGFSEKVQGFRYGLWDLRNLFDAYGMLVLQLGLLTKCVDFVRVIGPI